MKKILKNLVYAVLSTLPFSAMAQTPCGSLSVAIVNDAPVITHCYGPQCSNLTAYVMGDAPPYTYAWSSGHTSSAVAVCHNTTISFIVVVRDTNGCAATASTVVQVINACCEGTNVIICMEGDTLCVDSADVPNYILQGATVGPCPPLKPGSATGLGNNTTTRTSLSVYPNPFTQSVMFEMKVQSSGSVRIEIMDVTGRKVDELNNSFTSAGTYKLTWNGAGAADGIYFCRIITGDKVQNVKIQKLSVN